MVDYLATTQLAISYSAEIPDEIWTSASNQVRRRSKAHVITDRLLAQARSLQESLWIASRALGKFWPHPCR